MYDLNQRSLEHYGILGMRWGIRRYQNSDGTLTAAGKARTRVTKSQYKSGMYMRDPGEDFTIPAGTKLYRVSYSDSDPSKNMYVTTNAKDRNYYKGNYSNSLMSVGKESSKLKERTYETTEELKVPSLDKRKAAFEEISKDRALQAAAREALANQYIQRYGGIKVNSIKDAKAVLKDKNLDPEDKEVLDGVIKGAPKYATQRVKDIDFSKNAQMSAQTMSQLVGASDKVRDAYINVLKKQGYNATVDDFGGKQLWGTQGTTTEALIVFDPGKSSSVKSNVNVNYRDQQKLQKGNMLADYKYDAKVLGDETTKQILKLYNRQMMRSKIATVGGVVLGAAVPGGAVLVDSLYRSSAQKTAAKIRELEEEKRKNYQKKV